MKGDPLTGHRRYPNCTCREVEGDNSECPVHNEAAFFKVINQVPEKYAGPLHGNEGRNTGPTIVVMVVFQGHRGTDPHDLMEEVKELLTQADIQLSNNSYDVSVGIGTPQSYDPATMTPRLDFDRK